jgi:beta-lactamase regulating signal transducer with metallopeptidase domain
MSEAFIPVISLLAKSTLIVLFAGALVLALKALRVSASARHQVWVTAFVVVALLPLLALTLPRITIALPYSALGIAVPDLSTPGEHLLDRLTGSWIWSIYAIGAGLMLARLVGARVALRALWRSARPHAAQAEFDEIKRIAGVSAAIEIRVSDKPIAPLTWGDRVLLPASAIDWPAQRMRNVLLHELCHMARRDSLTQMSAAVVRAVFWFSPAVWFALRELRVEQEHACDECVLTGGVASADYAQTLLDVAMGSRPAHLGMGVSTAMVQRSNLERRVLTILKPAQARLLRTAHKAMLGVVLLCAGAVLAAAQPRDSARMLGPLASLETILQPLDPETQRLAPLSPLTTRVDAPDANNER